MEPHAGFYTTSRDVTEVPVGPAGATTSTDTYLGLLEARLLFAGSMDAIPEDEWRKAREVWSMAWLGYQAQQPRFAADPLLGHLFAKPDLNLEANSACANLCTILGLRLLNKRNTLGTGAGFGRLHE